MSLSTATTTTTTTTTPSSSGDQQYRPLLQKLHTLEAIIVSMFEVNQVSQILKDKLYQVEALLGDDFIVEDDNRAGRALLSQWQNKLAVWWKQYMIIELNENAKKTVGGGDAEEPKQSQQNSALTEPAQATKRTLPRAALPETPFDDQLSKDYLVSQLRDVFGEVEEVCSDADFAGMKRLVSIVVRAMDLLPPTRNDPKLQECILQLAMSRMSEPMRQSFFTQYEPPYTLYSLFHFLRLELEAYCDNNKLLLTSAGQVDNNNVIIVEEGGGEEKEEMALGEEENEKDRKKKHKKDKKEKKKHKKGKKGNDDDEQQPKPSGDDNAKPASPPPNIGIEAGDGGNGNNNPKIFCFKCYDYGHFTSKCKGPTPAFYKYKITI